MDRTFDEDGYTVTVIEEGQRRAYGDSYYTYDITPPANATTEQVRAFCETLRASKPKKDAQWYEGQTLAFEKRGETWRYQVCEAYTS
jgi:hypothetical protein